MSTFGRIRIREAVLASFTLAMGCFIGIQTWMTPSMPAQQIVGPGLFPAIIATALVLVGLWLAYESFVRPSADEERLEFDWKATAIVAAAFASQYVLLERMGWIISGTLLFAVSAVAFGSKAHIRNVLLGLALTSVTYVLFDYGLDLDLPVGEYFEDLFASSN
ncbi:tripartite tricarboxylate transporter TctB family protein [Agrobacterium tumefaciens]|uniref:Tripartite tricarboxylate transporter TctB family protein n=1 Tax=Agrobacterium tumefaciens TaxID=358 RepID=A0AA44F727_AGRTU|nr:tripartite tricarboxylate transporter TctB family protein [Agrobacterium tumefaciens]NTB87557.1 tripartite tricarboxylate transporter TctB family protein [Agrobacterium tumefaciens]NTC19748.1 tripartite tricarboxylate transporter TctB family protein [Agrobacterium tumefaciens]NTC29676.1 tripartite tricarboxylate transporter TctB family protein [Agrobacterium tumefaciens]